MSLSKKYWTAASASSNKNSKMPGCLKIVDDGQLILEHGTSATAVWTPLLAYEFMALENVTSA